jgi:hypothetical protein
MGISIYDAEKIIDYDLAEVISTEQGNRINNLSKLHKFVSKEKRLDDLKKVFLMVSDDN